jgi:hypothetical protein
MILLKRHAQLSTSEYQQQQHSLLSQASWGRLEMKPKRDDKQGDTQRDINDTRQEYRPLNITQNN